MSKKDKVLEINSELKKLFPNAKIALNYKTPIDLFVAVVLSAQTTDKQVNVVTEDLFKKYPTLKDYINTPLSEFEQDIKRIGPFLRIPETCCLSEFLYELQNYLQ